MAEKKKVSSFDAEMTVATKKVREYKVVSEANIVAILYKNKDLFYDYDKLKLQDFGNNIWKVYWKIGYDIVIKESKTLDELTIGIFLEKHPKLKEKYDEYGGYDTIIKAGEFVDEKNMEGYVKELHKWNVVLKMLEMRFPVADRLSEFADMSVDDIYDEYESMLNHIFINVETDVKSYGVTNGIYDLIESLNEGMAVGLPYHNMPLLTKETSGKLCGNITLVGGLSNVGKSTFVRNTTFPSILENDEKLCIILTEEDKSKWQREFLVLVANTVFKQELHKYQLRDGKFTEETKELLIKCAKWLEEKDKDGKIIFIPLQKYKTSIVVKIINKYTSAFGIKHYILDTFKPDSGSTENNSWLVMQQNMVEIYDAIKTGGGKDVHIDITLQLAKSSATQRYYTQQNTGIAKNVLDVASTGIFIRNIMSDEYPNEKNELKVYRLDGKNGKSRIPVRLDKDKNYQIIFIVKNREGSANAYQIVVEHNLSTNELKEIGITHVREDF